MAVQEGADTGLSLIGNLTWAASPFAARDRSTEAGMAIVGALLGSLAPDLAAAAAASSEDTQGSPGWLERYLIQEHDKVLQWVAGKVEGQRMTPAKLNARVWELLFPQLPYRASLSQLAAAIQQVGAR
jgi:hypothetical protein